MTKKKTTLWKQELDTVLASKQEEFRLLGYEKATKDNIWNCLEKQVWRGNPELHLFEVVADILRLTPMKYMNYLTIDTYGETSDLMTSINALMGAEMND